MEPDQVLKNICFYYIYEALLSLALAWKDAKHLIAPKSHWVQSPLYHSSCELNGTRRNVKKKLIHNILNIEPKKSRVEFALVPATMLLFLLLALICIL